MDGQRFDALTRMLAVGATRRRVLGLAAGLLASLTVGARPSAADGSCGDTCDDARPCSTTTGCGTCCDSVCVNLSTDLFNCGACGVMCQQGQGCISGGCVALCAPGLSKCGEACLDLFADPSNCGFCGNACPEGQDCVRGACAGACTPDQTLCEGACVDLASDPDNCGVCGASCGTGQPCLNGFCADSCGAGLSPCSGECVDLDSDPANCGGCGATCSSDHACDRGICVSSGCSAGLSACGGACLDLDSDPDNCGGCGAACARDETCDRGVCSGSGASGACPSGQMLCSASCVDTDADDANCGACGFACGSDETCVSGACMASDDAAASVPDSAPTAPGDGRIPEPTRCTVAPRTGARLAAACTTVQSTNGATPVAPPGWESIVTGQTVDPVAASDARRTAVQATLDQFVACVNAGDLLRQSALMTDQMAGSLLRVLGLCDTVPGIAVSPMASRRWKTVEGIGGAYDAGNDRVNAIVAIDDPTKTDRHIRAASFVDTADGWVIDRWERIALDGGAGSVTVRAFACDGTKPDDATCKAMPLPFGVSLFADDGTASFDLRDAAVVAPGVVRWRNVPFGRYQLTADADLSERLRVDGARPVADSTAWVYHVDVSAWMPDALIDLFETPAAGGATVQIRGANAACGAASCPPCTVCDAASSTCVATCLPGETCDADGVTCRCDRYASTICATERGACKGDAGDGCDTDDQCCDGVCIDGVCACFGESEPCADSAACCDGLTCWNDVCLPCSVANGDACEATEECCEGACVDGVCRCCVTCETADGAYRTRDLSLCCPQDALCYPDTDLGPGFARCCTPGVDCLGDPFGPPPTDGANARMTTTC